MQASGSKVSGIAFETDSNITILNDGDRLFTVNFAINVSDASFLFSTSKVLWGPDATVLNQFLPIFAGTPNTGELVFVNDGSTLGAVTDNTFHYAQDSQGIHFKYDTNSAAGTLSQSAEVYIAGIADPVQHLSVL